MDTSDFDQTAAGIGGLAIDLLDSRSRWPDDVAVWRLDVATAPDALETMSAWLDEAERTRAARYRQHADRARFVSSRYALRCLLGQCVGRHPADLRFDLGAHGKPSLASHAGWSFNVSHAGMQALIAISAHRNVGVDIESIDPAFDWRPVAEMVCGTREQQAIHAGGPLQQQHFLRCWTAKEALVKALGTGIGDSLAEIAVDPLGAGVQCASAPAGGEHAAVAGLRLHWLTELVGYVGCVAFGEAEGIDVD
jgi:4'-phosphopantetheinyl transferase